MRAQIIVQGIVDIDPSELDELKGASWSDALAVVWDRGGRITCMVKEETLKEYSLTENPKKRRR